MAEEDGPAALPGVAPDGGVAAEAGDRVRAAVGHLLRRGVVRPGDVVDRGVRAFDASRSHSVVVVRIDGGRQVVVKAATGGDDVQGSPARELAAYRLAEGRAPARGLLPARVDPGGDPSYLVMEEVAGSSALEALATGAPGHEAVPARIGRSLAAWHRATRPARDFPPLRPWVLDALSDAAPAFVRMNEGVRAFVHALSARRPGLRSGLSALDARWSAEAVVHGDLRFDNCLLGDAADDGVVFIDWETAGWGDPAWDLAAAVQEVLTLGPVAEDLKLVDGRRAGWIRSLLGAYATAAGADGERAVRRVGPFLGARLLQRAMQVAAWNPAGLIPENRALAELSVRLLSQPDPELPPTLRP